MNFMVVLDVSRVKSSQRTHDWAVGADSFKLVSGAKDDGIVSLLTSNQLFNPLWDGSSSKTCTLFFFVLFKYVSIIEDYPIPSRKRVESACRSTV